MRGLRPRILLSGAVTLALAAACLRSAHTADDGGKASGPTWLKPQISIYNPPPVEKSTSTVFRAVDPQIIQKLIDLIDESTLAKKETEADIPSLKELNTYRTPEGNQLKNRYQYLGATLSESLGWEPIKHVRVISEQNLKQRLTTVARWDHTPVVRSIALTALASLKDKNDLVYFREALWSRNIGIRHAVIEALQKWGYAEAVPLLTDLANKDESRFIRVVAAQAIASMGDPSGIELLRAGLQDKDWLVRAMSAKGMGEYGSVEDYDALLNQLSREQSLTSNDFVAAEISIAALKLFPQKVAKDKEEREKRKKKAAAVPPAPAPIPKSEPKPKKDVLFELNPLVVTAPRVKITQNDIVDSRINFQLSKTLTEKQDLRITDEQANQSLSYKDLDALVTPNGVQLKARYTVLGYLLTEGIAGTRDFQLVDQLRRMVQESQNPDIRSFALIALAYCRDRSHLYLFQEGLRKEDAFDRFAAVQALSIWGYPDAVSNLITVTKLDTSPIVRVYAAQAALRMGDINGKDYLVRALDDSDLVARAMAMRYLGELGGPEDYNRLLSYLGSDQKNIVQAEMCSALLRLYAKKIESEKP